MNTQLAMKVVVSRVRLQVRGAEDVVACFVAADELYKQGTQTGTSKHKLAEENGQSSLAVVAVVSRWWVVSMPLRLRRRLWSRGDVSRWFGEGGGACRRRRGWR